MKRPIIYPYKMGSKSSKILARAVGALRVYPDKAYRAKDNHLIINWGNSEVPSWAWRRGGRLDTILNDPKYVAIASNKIASLTKFKMNNVSCPDFTTDIEEAKQWIRDNYKVVIRSTVTGHGGQGITIAESEDQLIPAPLYTKYFNGKREFRVHVFMDNVIDFTEKKRRSETEDVNVFVRNHDNGWVFCREGITLPDVVTEESIKAIKALGLDFGAVDIRYRERDGQASVLEVNTAPGLEGTTITKYAEAIRRIS